MITYERLKNKLNELKPKIIYGACLVIIFAVGWGTGKAQDQKSTAKSVQDDSNYTIKTTETTKDQPKEAPPADAKQSPQNDPDPNTPLADNKVDEGNKPDPNKPCVVKGNVSSSGKVYHVKGGAFYERTTPEQCFNTPDQAEVAGFRKSKK